MTKTTNTTSNYRVISMNEVIKLGGDPFYDYVEFDGEVPEEYQFDEFGNFIG